MSKLVAIRQLVDEDEMRIIVSVFSVDSVEDAEVRERELHQSEDWEYETRIWKNTTNGLVGEVCALSRLGDFYRTEIWRIK